MKICFTLSQLRVIAFLSLSFETAYSQAGPPQARIVNLNVEPEQVIVLHLEPGYVSSVRVREDVSSVVLGDPGSFRAEHSDAEPQLVFFKTTSAKPARTNALVTTKAGREISLSLVSNGKQGRGEIVDYVLNCERPRSFLISPAQPSVLVAESKTVAIPESKTDPPPVATKPSEELLHVKLHDPHWKGKQLRIAAGQPLEMAGQTVVPFAVLNTSERTVEILPPQIELVSSSKAKKRKGIKAEPVPITDYAVTTRTLGPGARADGVVFFERPTFKESGERLLLAVAQASEVDRPVLTEIAFVSPISGGSK